MKPSEVVAIAVRSALYAMRNPTPAASPTDMPLKLDEWQAMYVAQCEATDEWARRARAAESARAPSTLEARIKELESQLAAVNGRLGVANSTAEVATVRAARAVRAMLDDCTHPDCVEDRKRIGYSCCAGGHLARDAVKAILGTEKIPA